MDRKTKRLIMKEMEGLILQRTINTIEIMENTSLAVDSSHYHAFQHVPGAISNSIVFRLMTQRQSCCICKKKLSPFLFSSSQRADEKNCEPTNNDDVNAAGFTSSKKSNGIVKCVACGIYVHRDCLTRASSSSSSSKTGSNKMQVPICPVNQPLVAESMKKHYNHDLSELYDDDDDNSTSSGNSSNDSGEDMNVDKKTDHDAENTIENEKYTSTTCKKANTHDEYADAYEEIPYGENYSVMPPPYPILPNKGNSIQYVDDDSDNSTDSSSNVWTSNGPPMHWALHHPEALHQLNEEIQRPKNNFKSDQDDASYTVDNTTKSIQNNFESSFSQVSQLLQDHLLSIIHRQKDKIKNSNSNLNYELNNDDCEENIVENNEGMISTRETNTLDGLQKTSIIQEGEEIIGKTLQNQDSISSTSPGKERNLRENLRIAHSKYKQFKQTQSNITAVTVAGSIAGGVAGLVVAGPAGAYMGMRLGQACGGALGISGSAVLVYSSVAAISAAGAGTIVNSKKKKEIRENVRMLTLGEEGLKQKMMLVRPNVVVSEEWEQICFQLRREWCTVYLSQKQNDYHSDIQYQNMNASGNKFSPKKNSPKKGGVLNSIIQNMTNSEDPNTKNKDDDILGTDENEIGMSDKILLLVNRSLNDKNSQPAYIYRGLIKEFRIRNQRRKTVPVESPKRMNNNCADHSQISNKEAVQSTSKENFLDEKHYSRERRQDAHGVIKFVTATLLDIRPNFGRSQTLTEMSATAVEDLVFGEIYDEVFEEILNETAQKDDVLMSNIHAFENHKNCDPDQNEMLSLDALRALRDLCESHSPADKLIYCVDFLESISTKFSSAFNTTNNSATLGADTLLKLVCQHLIAAKNPRINAETLFLDEFARDEQLLKGKEGYALITLQAALHFLNSKDNVESVLFS